MLGLIYALGIDGIDAGTLADSWRKHPGTPAYCRDLDADWFIYAGVGRERRVSGGCRWRAGGTGPAVAFKRIPQTEANRAEPYPLGRLSRAARVQLPDAVGI